MTFDLPDVVVYSPHPAVRVEEAFLGLKSIQPHIANGIGEAALLLQETEAEILVSPRWEPRCMTPSLRWIQSVASGVEPFPLKELRENGVVLTSARYVSHEAMAEHAFGLLLSLTLNFPQYRDQAHRREWTVEAHGTLAETTVGILGLGAVGEALAARLSRFRVHVIGTKRNVEAYEGHADEVFPPDATTEVCRLADSVVVCVPLDDRTRGLIGAEELAALGRGYVVNVSRGPVIDDAALLQALHDGRVAGAGLDVLSEEPLPPESPWWDAPGTIITPHVAGKFHGYGKRLADLFERNLGAFQTDGEWENRVV